MCPKVTGRRKSSPLWNFFDAIDSTFAKCHLCESKFSYKTTTSNLSRHLRTKHSVESSDVCELSSSILDTVDCDKFEKSDDFPPNGRRSAIWAFFERIDAEFARCNTCKQTFSYKSSITNLKKHLSNKRHCAGIEDPKDVSESLATKPTTSRKTSALWRYFEPISAVSARCNTCHMSFSYKGSTSNLRKHFLSKHADVAFEQTNELVDPLDDATDQAPASPEAVETIFIQYEAQPSPKRAKTSNVWSFFLQVDEGTAKCHYCQQNISFKSTTSNLWKHLKSKHADVLAPTSTFKALERKLMDLFIKDLHCFSLVEQNAFGEFVAALNSSYKLPTLETVTESWLPTLYGQCVKNTKALLEMGKSFCLTVYPWIDCYTFIAHFLDDDFRFHSVLLQYSETMQWENVIKDWNIQNKPVTIVSPNLGNCVSTILNSVINEARTIEENETELSTILKPFQEALSNLNEHYCTAALAIPMYNALKTVLSKLSSSLADVFQTSLQKHFADLIIKETFQICTFLDPKFKNVAFGDEAIANQTKDKLVSLISEKIEETSVNKEENVQNDDNIDLWLNLDQTIAIANPRTSSSRAKIEMKRFLEEDFLARTANSLNWWREHQQMLPTLADIAQKNLCMLASATPPEPFLTQGAQILERRYDRGELQTQMLLFLNANYKHLD